jgi:type III pantothenate kinase
MLLAIDAGNTNVVFAVFDGAEQRGLWRCSTDPRRTADEYAVWLLKLLELEGLGRHHVDGAIIASVVPDATPNLQRLCERHFGQQALVVGSDSVKLGLEVLIDNPREAGADRLVNAVAACAVHEGPLMVIDFGTATTFDIVNRDGNFVGGVIAPGINLSSEALHRAAAKLPRVEIEQTDTVVGRNTVTAMQSGLYWGYVGLIEGLVSRIKAEMGGELYVLATGGLAALFARATPVIQHTDPDLTLRGLYLIYERNTRR